MNKLIALSLSSYFIGALSFDPIGWFFSIVTMNPVHVTSAQYIIAAGVLMISALIIQKLSEKRFSKV